jgi:hypothetical protein
MSPVETMDWYVANQRYLMARLTAVRDRLTRHAGKVDPPVELPIEPPEGGPAALDSLCNIFGLTPFERDVLLLCAGADLDSAFPEWRDAAAGETHTFQPTFGLALAALADAHWSAILPSAPLRFWRLIEITAGDHIVASPLRIDERILHYLAGTSYLDARLQPSLHAIAPPEHLAGSHQNCAERIARFSAGDPGGASPVIQLMGEPGAEAAAVAASAAASLGLQLYALSAADIHPGADRALMARLLDREFALSRAALLIEWDEPEHRRAAAALADSIRGVTIIAGREPLPVRRRRSLRVELERPSTADQHELWTRALGPAAEQLNGALAPVVAQFHLGGPAIEAAGAEARSRTGGDAASNLWEACRTQSRSRMEGLAQRIEATAGWDELVLPESQIQMLREIAQQVRHRPKVYETWGFASRGARGLGISALFYGQSGTGKTMSAEVIARDLRVDLYRIDLSQVVSKYIGETEKNLQRVFDAAEESGAVLLFDEADALFGKRSEVKDSHDRYANIEVSYLLQRMESYRGLAILTTNMKTLLDPAFVRRIRFIVQFPFPEAMFRGQIWQRAFPATTPTEGLDIERLARLNLPGGNIRNIALHAAFLAANEDQPVRMTHLLRAAHNECAKLDRPMTESESRGWV